MFTRDSQIMQIMLIMLIAATARADVVFVDDDAPPGGDGMSWATSYRFLQDALAAAEAGTEIRIAGGQYQPDRTEAQPDGSEVRSASFGLLDGVVLRGGYRGLAAEKGESPDDRDVAAFETVLSGDLAGNDEPGFVGVSENSFHVVVAEGLGRTSQLDGLSIAHGNADGSGDDGRGAGLVVLEGEPTLNDCTIRTNRSLRRGAGVLAVEASPTFTSCTFDGNRAGVDGGDGGGAYCTDGGPVFTACRFTRSVAANGGGGLTIVDAVAARVDGCVFSTNSAVGPSGGGTVTAGGGLEIFGGEGEVTGCAFFGNTTEGGDLGGVGGAISVASGTWVVRDCVMAGNVTTVGAGAAFNQSTDTRYENCTFIDNVVLADEGVFQQGGAMYNQVADVVLVGCTFEGNWAAREGGAVYNNEAEPTIDGCMFFQNVAPVGGGALFSFQNAPTVSDSVFCDNFPDHVVGPFVDDGGNTFCPLCDGDVDGDGEVGFLDLLQVLSTWGPCPPEGDCSADIDESEEVDFADLLVVLTSWGRCAGETLAWPASLEPRRSARTNGSR